MEQNILKLGFWKMAVVAGGFGFGGLVWGWEAYRGTVGSDEVFTNPFSYILGAVAMGLFGGLALSYIVYAKEQNTTQKRGKSKAQIGLFEPYFNKTTLKIVGFGIAGWVVAFVVPAVAGEWLLILGAVIQPLLIIATSFTDADLTFIFNLKPSLSIAGLWVEFLFTGVIVSLIYSSMLKTKIIRTVLYGAGGFALASLIAPIFGNLVGNLFNSLFIAYLLTFLFIGATFGNFLYLTTYNKEKEGSASG